jgi:ABC-type uncharacterized transport system permease subunit
MITTTQLKEPAYLKAWAFFWVLSTLGGFVAGLLAGAMLGFLLGGLGVRLHTIRILCGGVGFLVGIPISYVLFQLSIRKVLLPSLPPPVRPPV